MRFLSCFSGIEAASVAWRPLGWHCVGVAEIEPFPCAVLAHHYPDVPNLGSVIADDFLERAAALKPDVLVGGPPCQDFSIAGLRAGLGGARGNLTLRWVQIIHAVQPRFVVTENVPGWLSVNNGHAFGAFLAVLWARIPRSFLQKNAEDDGQTQVWLLAQMGGQHGASLMPNISTWPNDAVVCSLSSVLQTGPIPPRFFLSSKACSGILRRAEVRGRALPPPLHAALAHVVQTTIKGTPLVPVAYQVTGNDGARATGDITGALDTGTDRTSTVLVFSCKDHGADAGDVAPTMRAMGHAGSHANAGGQIAVATYGFQPRIARNGRGDMGDVVSALNAQSGETGKGDAAPCVATGHAVRRLTPMDCERLQGFPDGYSDVPWRGKDCAPDGNRYKALGNSMAIPVMRWIGERIQKVDTDRLLDQTQQNLNGQAELLLSQASDVLRHVQQEMQTHEG
jgi:DNA (cytosine-5)-methyltransferase 1